MNYVDPGLIVGGLGCLGGAICLIALRRHRMAIESARSELRSELNTMVHSALDEYKVECAEQIAQLGRNVATLERAAQNIDEAGKGGLTRSVRSQAMHLLRSGMQPESAASVLGVGKREMRLIASVAGILSLK